MGAGPSSTCGAEQIDVASLHALAVTLRKPAVVCSTILDHEIDGLTAMELDEASVCELVESKLDQKKVWAAVKQFRQSQEHEGSTERGGETPCDAGLGRRVSDLEHEVWELRSTVEEIRNRRSPAPVAAAPKRVEPEEPMNLEDRIRALEDEILALCDAAPQGSMLAANLPRLYYYRYGRNLDFRSLGFLKLSQLLAKMSRIEFDGSHRALVSKKTVLKPLPAFPLFHQDFLHTPGEEDLLPSYLLRETVLS
mmetsp:Transcript_12852/g.40770  ORF Transcript_12852/g.40770 Transcript_12852/m.40770 type:complete len:252 (-) Transcript_12852:542-1297(-)|eukprot:CAMPEP_0197394928 /NCGR_PEP_ID=MMETSP1165-20131217/6246_1 /TAXON_ID=284809 /ORGANISM="Chrysocystis fragilis, Strain CCMP3189" /LENGTH=251 /DNA_ID=CAMNT_0042920667 /DNA_START=118 /DNA_END=873 /DNA_ORIENTATION=-